MSVSEGRLEDRLTKWLKKNKIKWKTKAHGELLDRWLLLPNGHLFIIELKKPKAKASPKTGRRQWKEINDLRELGYDVEVHNNYEEAIEAITLRLETACLPENSCKVHVRKQLRSSLSRSKSRENFHYARCTKNIKK